MNTKELKEYINGGALDAELISLYGNAALSSQKERCLLAVENFEKLYGDEREASVFSVSGRSELSGNHTDHNLGCVIAASVDLDIIAVASPTDDGVVRLTSEGFGESVVSLKEYREPREELFGTSESLIAGVADGFIKNSYKVGGFLAYTTSNVLKGSGLSSSAAFENMIGNIMSHFYNGGAVDNVEIAKLSQYAENAFFGKPCGLMDQIACAVGGIVAIDFSDASAPMIEKIETNPTDFGYSLCIVNTGGNHADLTPDYAAVPAEMKAVAAALGVDVLRRTDKAALFENMSEIREKLGDRAVLRAMHFFSENERVEAQKAALKARDVAAFFEGAIASGRSSFCYLQNVYTTKNVAEQGISLALCIAEDIITRASKGGAWRVHGGGFAGTVQAFVPDAALDEFKKTMERVFGEGSCYILKIRARGAVKVI